MNFISYNFRNQFCISLVLSLSSKNNRSPNSEILTISMIVLEHMSPTVEIKDKYCINRTILHALSESHGTLIV